MWEAIAMSSVLEFVAACCLALALSFPGQHAGPDLDSTNPYASLEGQLCSPPRKETCGEVTDLGMLSAPAPRSQFGPNVCSVTRMSLARQLDYRYQRFCSGYPYFEQQCTVQCLPANTCEEAVRRLITEEYTRCCDGFTSRPLDDRVFAIYYNYWDVLEPPGCPVAHGPSLRQCMSQQGLDAFLAQYRRAKPVCPLLRVLKIEGALYTVFAPTDPAFNDVSDQLESLNRDDVCTILLGHIVSGKLETAHLFNGMVLTSLAGTALFVTKVQHYTFVDEGRELIQQAYFINGAQVSLRDACDKQTVSGALQIIDQVLLPAPLTTVQVLHSNPMFSTFLDALERVPFLLQMISSAHTPSTIFAPTNDAFNRSTYSTELLECLVSDAGVPLTSLLLYHMVRGVEYSTSLSLQRYWVRTLSVLPLLLDTTENGTLLLGEDQVEVVQADIPASNGVVHAISEVLAVPELDFGDCEIFAPTEPPSPTPTPTPTPSVGSGSGDTGGNLAPVQDIDIL